jgi:hypothetical protein
MEIGGGVKCLGLFQKGEISMEITRGYLYLRSWLSNLNEAENGSLMNIPTKRLSLAAMVPWLSRCRFSE